MWKTTSHERPLTVENKLALWTDFDRETRAQTSLGFVVRHISTDDGLVIRSPRRELVSKRIVLATGQKYDRWKDRAIQHEQRPN
jgi:hypothetical protein